MAKTTILALLTEMQSFVPVTPEALEKAKASKVHINNNDRFQDLVMAWINGDYDESPELVVQEIEFILDYNDPNDL